MVEGGGLLNRYSGVKLLSRVRIPPSPFAKTKPILYLLWLVRTKMMRSETNFVSFLFYLLK